MTLLASGTLAAGTTVTPSQLTGRSQAIVALQVPEPGTLGLLTTGLVVLGLFGWKRRRNTGVAAYSPKDRQAALCGWNGDLALRSTFILAQPGREAYKCYDKHYDKRHGYQRQTLVVDDMVIGKPKIPMTPDRVRRPVYRGNPVSNALSPLNKPPHCLAISPAGCSPISAV